MAGLAAEAADLLRRLADRAAAAGQIGDETQTLAALIALRPPQLSPVQLVRIWRELTAGPAEALVVWPGRDPVAALDHARLRFGAAARLTLAARPESALAAARGGAVAICALEPDIAWWGRLLAEPRLKVFAALPEIASLGPISALAVADRAPEPTGADLTFWVTDAAAGAPAIEAALGADGVAAIALAEAGGLRLFTLAGFYQGDDPRLARAPGRLSGVIGSAPAPLAV